MLKKWMFGLAMIAVLSIGAVGCDGDDDDVQDIIDTVLATDTPEAQETVAPTEPAGEETPDGAATVGTELTRSEGDCIHGQGESTLIIIGRGYTPGETVTLLLTTFPEGGLGPEQSEELSLTADGNGEVRADVAIRRFGDYAWTLTDSQGEEVTGSFTVEAECPGVIQ